MRIVHTVSSLEAVAAGTTYAVTRLAKSIATLGHEVELLSLGEPRQPDDGGYGDLRFKRDFARVGPLGKLGVSTDMRRAIASSEADIFHTHGLWMMPNVYPAKVAHERRRPLVLSPHGMLGKEALRFSTLKKRLFWALLQGRAAHRVSCFHATAAQEYEDIRAFGLKQPVAVIPNGIDLPALPPHSRPGSPVSPFVLFLGRIHPIKGLDRLIHAWALVAPAFPQWRLRIVGPSEVGHADELKKLARELKLDSVEIAGAVFGEEKMAMLAEADLFVLPSLSENFGMTIAESLAVGTPSISTKGTPWSGLETERCGWWIDHGIEPLAAALRHAMTTSPDERQAMGARGRAWMERDFSWDGIARQTIDVYRWLADNGTPPASVRLD